MLQCQQDRLLPVANDLREWFADHSARVIFDRGKADTECFEIIGVGAGQCPVDKMRGPCFASAGSEFVRGDEAIADNFQRLDFRRSQHF